ncbi:MAG TPA: PAS domain S-box protein [Terriglobales bacterium]|jgi:PAS domain S-box-containing protein|nr:PAS domain S-box protein [Terriglobales bacterium]
MAQPYENLHAETFESWEQYRSLVEHAPEVLALLDAEGKILYINPHTEKVLGHHRYQVEGLSIFEFLHPADLQRAAQEYMNTLQQKGERVPSVLRIRDSAGEWVPFEIIANNCLDNPDLEAVIFTGRDLRYRRDIEAAIQRANADTEAEVTRRTTELIKMNAELRIENQARRQAETQLQHTVSLLHATLDSTADGILVVALDGKITKCNKKFVEMWRLNCGETDDRDDQALLSHVSQQLESPHNFLDKVRTLYEDPAATSFDVLLFKDGRIFERYSQPQHIDDKITGRVWSFRDVTRARNMEAELHQYQKMEALGKLAGGVAHDFNNLLMLISGYTTDLKESVSSDREREICERMLATTRQAASVTKQLLTFCRKQPEAAAVADLNLIVLNLEPMLRRLLPDHIQLEVSLESEPLLVYVDISQVETMIMNLVVNAQDAMPEAGRLLIATSCKLGEEGPAKNDPAWAVLQVSDTGAGMTPEMQLRIFEPFFTTKDVGRGTGLGLATVLGIAQKSGGRIEVKSAPGKGSTFRALLPRAKGAIKAAPRLEESPIRGGSETILLAEDEPGIRAMTRTYLESLGYRVLEASDGLEAIAQSLEYAGPIDLFISDLLMPRRRGDSAAKAIRSQRPEIKTIFISGYADHDVTSAPEDILYKPFTFPELASRVRSVLEGSPVLGSNVDFAAD